MMFKNEETRIQVAVVNYIRYKYPRVLFTIAPSGMKLPIHVARMLKAMGYQAGTPDLLIFEPGRGYHGLMIELKTPSGKTSQLQEGFLNNLHIRGYYVCVAKGYDEAIGHIDEYFKSVEV